MQAEVDALRNAALGGIAQLPEAAVPADSKDALSALVAELPNPSGRLVVAFRAEEGFGPARLAPFAINGLPQTMAEAAPLFRGVAVDVGWTHVEQP
jgi:hypothetical protein